VKKHKKKPSEVLFLLGFYCGFPCSIFGALFREFGEDGGFKKQERQ
jgi:hypothetical protein